MAVRDADAVPWLMEPPSTPENVVFRAVQPTEIAFHAVSTKVSSSRSDGPDLIEPFVLEATLF